MTIGDVQLISSFVVSAPPTKFAAKCDMIPGLGSGRGRGGRQTGGQFDGAIGHRSPPRPNRNYQNKRSGFQTEGWIMEGLEWRLHLQHVRNRGKGGRGRNLTKEITAGKSQKTWKILSIESFIPWSADAIAIFRLFSDSAISPVSL